MTSRIGFWLWYTIPLLALVLGNILVSAALYGIYGTFRGLSSIAIFSYALHHQGWNYSDWLLHQVKVATRWNSIILVVIAGVLAIRFGFFPN